MPPRTIANYRGMKLLLPFPTMLQEACQYLYYCIYKGNCALVKPDVYLSALVLNTCSVL